MLSKDIMDEKINYGWQKSAACTGMPIEAFYPAQGKTVSSKLVDMCTECPVKTECLDHALKYEEYGYWGNTGPIKRREMRKELGIELTMINTLFLASQYEHEKVEPIKIRKRIRKVAECGTRSGYNAHIRKKEPTCQACKDAQTKSIIEFNKNKKDKENEVLF
jgi:hypothetical protein